MPLRKRGWAWVLAGVLVATLLAATAWKLKSRPRDTLPQRLAQIVPLPAGAARPCAVVLAGKPWVLLALGQSNAGNHGQAAPGQVPPPVWVFAEGQCAQVSEPLPGATGLGASVWSRLAQELQVSASAVTSDRAHGPRPVLIINLAVDASSSTEWVSRASPLRQRLVGLLEQVRQQGLPVHALLWQQGEADARQEVPASVYQQNLIELRQLISSQGFDAPMFLAKSTVCRSPAHSSLRGAVDVLAAGLGGLKGFSAGPDTDALVDAAHASQVDPAVATSLPPVGTMRFDGCHFGPQGLAQAAKRWADALQPALSPRP